MHYDTNLAVVKDEDRLEVTVSMEIKIKNACSYFNLVQKILKCSALRIRDFHITSVARAPTSSSFPPPDKSLVVLYTYSESYMRKAVSDCSLESLSCS